MPLLSLCHTFNPPFPCVRRFLIPPFPLCHNQPAVSLCPPFFDPAVSFVSHSTRRFSKSAVSPSPPFLIPPFSLWSNFQPLRRFMSAVFLFPYSLFFLMSPSLQ